MTTAFIASLLIVAATMLALSIGPVFRKRKPQCSCKTAKQLMAATDPRRANTTGKDPRNSPLLPIISDDQGKSLSRAKRKKA